MTFPPDMPLSPESLQEAAAALQLRYFELIGEASALDDPAMLNLEIQAIKEQVSALNERILNMFAN